MKNTGPTNSSSFGWGGGESSKKVQMLYFPTDFSPNVSSGVISELFFMYGSTNGASVNSDFVNLNVKLGQTNETGFSPVTSFFTHLTPVLTEAQYTIDSGKAGEWFGIHLTNPFPYDPTQTLILEISFDSCINKKNSAGLGCFAGPNVPFKKLKSPIPTSLTGTARNEVLNFGFNFDTTTCSGLPVVGSTLSSLSTTVCGGTAVLSMSNNVQGLGIAYQWQYETKGSWINFGTNSKTQHTPPLTENTQFRCAVICNNSDTAYTDPVSIMVEPIHVNVGNDTIICVGAVLPLNAGNNGSTYLWNTGSTAQSILVNAAGTYSVTVTTPDGCERSDTVVIRSAKMPTLGLPVITDLCYGDTAVLDAGNSDCIFKWNDGTTLQTLKVRDSGTYQVRITSTDGCIAHDSTKVVIRPLPNPALGKDTAFCYGETMVLQAGNLGSTFLWNNGAITESIEVSDSGTYRVRTTTAYGCTLTEEVHITLLPLPKVNGIDFSSSDLAPEKITFEPLAPENYLSWKWDFGDGHVNNTDIRPVHSYALSGNYVVGLTLFNDCGTYQDSVALKVEVPVGISLVSREAKDIKLYPNPSSSVIYIESQPEWRMEKIAVFNILGKEVYHAALDHVMKYKLNLDQLPSGLYTVNLLTQQGWVVRKIEVRQ